MPKFKTFFRSLFSFRNPLLWVLLPLAIYIVLRLNITLDPELRHPANHFQIVSGTSIVSLILAIVIGIIGSRQRNLQVIYVSLAFISLAAFFSAHGLSTPGFILEQNQIVGVASQLSLLTMSFWLMVSSLPSDHFLSSWLTKNSRLLLPLYTPAIILLVVAALRNPILAEWIPVNQAPLRYIVAALTLFMSISAGYRYWQSYRYAKFPFQLAIAYTSGWIAVSQIIATTGQTWFLSWWIYHGLLLLSVLTVLGGLIVQYRRGDSLVRSILGLFSNDPAERLAAAISPSVRELITTTETRDPYTAGHSYRVAQGAFDLGVAMNMRPEDLRILAEGGIVHDVGKLQVPDKILNKPGPLNPEERKAIENHTVAGYELCSRLGFMPEELSVIRSHHERMDGSGYPDGLAGEDIPLVARILSVVDVYDALTSARAYRPAWQQSEAIAYLMENRGSQFEPRLVETWIKLVEKNGDSSSIGSSSK
jgi:putative nucleotidyltransferase with HDIG domain